MRDSDYWLENVIPQKPNYFSKEDQTVTYLSRLNFMTKVTIPQQQAAMLGILFGIVAIVLAIPTGGSSLYLMLIAGAEIGVGIMQIKVNSEKLRDLNEGNNYSNPAVIGMNQDTLNQLEMGLGVVSLAFLFKPNNLKIADKFKDSQRLAAFKEAAGNKYTSFKATMNDANIKMNPSNYKLSWEEAYSLSTNAGTMGRGPGRWRLDRVADEPFIQFSKSGSGGTGKPIPVTKVNYGDHFTKQGRKKVLKPNVEYKSPDGYTYRTDSHGRIVECEGDLVLGSAERNEYAQRTVGGKDRLSDDDGGHLIGAQFKGPKDIDNLVPQNSQINRSGGEWFNMETEWANALKEIPPKKVTVKIDPVYSGDSMRPDTFRVTYEIEGEDMVKKLIKNQAGG
ncbi:DNA/RNA non-specific endonuclease [Paenibacillus sp. NPDC058898]